jgi:hypothetical protein
MSITAIATKSGGPVLASAFGKFAVEQFVFFLQKVRGVYPQAATQI